MEWAPSIRCTSRAGALAVALLAPSVPGAAQQTDLRREIEASRLRLEEIQAERRRLEAEMDSVRIRVRDLARDLTDAERLVSQSRAALAEVVFLTDATATQIQETTSNLIRTQEEVLASRATLSRRLRDIYKLGPLHTVRVLLGASSFTDLLNRYRYLQRVATFDRVLVDDVSELERALQEQRSQLRQQMAELEMLQRSRATEVAQLEAAEAERQAMLTRFRSRERQTRDRLDELEADEARMTNLISSLERRRLEEERRASRGDGPASLSPGDAGALEWPVEGELVYGFGRQRRPNGLVLRWNGIGISAPTGTPVRAVRSGRVVLAGPFEGYGPTVVLDHGNGFYTLYLYLEEIGVVQGRDVESGQVVGTVGGADTPEGPHMEFQIRAPVDGGAPQAQDPLRWLRPRGGA